MKREDNDIAITGGNEMISPGSADLALLRMKSAMLFIIRGLVEYKE